MCSTPKATHPGRSQRLPSNYHSVFAGAGDVYRELEAQGALRGVAAPDPDDEAGETAGEQQASEPKG